MDTFPASGEGFTPEDVANKATSVTASDVAYPTSNAVKGYVDPLIAAINSGNTLVSKALSGDMVFSISPATKSTAHGSAASRTVTITLKDAAGDVHTWFNKAITAGVAIALSSVAGTATIASTVLTFVNGVATVVITIGGIWLAADTDTLTIAAAVIMGYTVPQVTSVETFS